MNVAAVGVLALTMMAGEQAPERAAVEKVGAKAGQLIRFEVLIADLTEAVETPSAEKILELEKAGKLQTRVRFELAAVEDVPASIQFAEWVSRVSQRANPVGRGRTIPHYSDVNVGTTLRVTGRVSEDKTIVTQFYLERTGLGDEVEQPAEVNIVVPPPAVKRMQSNATLKLKAGEPQVVGAQQNGAGQEASRTWIVVTGRMGAEAEGGK